ncbi:hypothetical protein SAMN04515648_0987 [Phyllobacterium sp. CL33Tsu]|nr:hypothetical protein SAMN04515648_0987 [Phyllobacterium sp. CL33Tsu]
MSTEIYGVHPDARVGEDFQPRWRGSFDGLVACLRALAPDIGAAWDRGSDGDTLKNDDCVALANELDRCLADGSVEQYVAERNAYIEQLPRVQCDRCGGAGICSGDKSRENELFELLGELAERRLTAGFVEQCNCCSGAGTFKDGRSYRDLYVSDVREFSEFLRHCGGFYTK